MKNTISIKWGIDDIRSLGYECTDEQGSKVLADVKRFHDANIGVNWEVIDWHCEENKLNKYPFNEGDDYWTIENGKIVWSCWDDQSEELYKEGYTSEYFKTEAQAEQSLTKHMKKCENIIIKSTKNN